MEGEGQGETGKKSYYKRETHPRYNHRASRHGTVQRTLYLRAKDLEDAAWVADWRGKNGLPGTSVGEVLRRALGIGLKRMLNSSRVLEGEER